MLRKIIQIDQEKCNGCGQCILACRESAIGFEGGKAKLMREDHCDGLGMCLPVCLMGAISFIEKEFSDSLAPNEQEVAVSKATSVSAGSVGGGCPSAAVRAGNLQWPIQIKLVPVIADFFQGADLLVAADCCAYTYPKFQEKYAEDKVRLIGCPKLDEVDYANKLAEIFASNHIKSITVVRMEVPCCDGMESAVRRALKEGVKDIPVHSFVLSIEGTVLCDGK